MPSSCSTASTPARRFVHHLFDALMADVATRGAGLDWKTSLQEIASLAGLGVPSYEVVESGPDHAKTFQAMVLIDDARFGPGAGRNKKEAEQNAAAIAFAALKAAARSRRPVRAPRDAALTAAPSRRRDSMPELPEVEVVRRGLAAGAHRPADRPGRGAAPATGPAPPARSRDFARPLAGRRFAEPRRRGKYLWLPLDRRRRRPGPPRDERPVPGWPTAAAAAQHPGPFTFADGGPELRFVDQRMFGGLSLVAGRRGAAGRVAHIGRDPFDPDSTRPRSSWPAAAQAHRGQARAAGPDPGLRDRQHLCRRGAVAGRLHYARPTATLTRAAAGGAGRGRG